MYVSTLLSATSLFVLAFASQGAIKREDNASILSEIDSLEDQMTLPASIQTYLTNVPSAVSAAFADKTGRFLLFESAIDNPPPWALGLPPNVQEYLLTNLYPKVKSVESLQAAAGLITGVPSGTGAVPTGTGGVIPTNGTAVTTGKLTASSAKSGGISKPTTPTSGAIADSTNAAQPTGAIAAGLVGAVGFLGVAMAL